jgi:hypothetical protein
MKLKSLGIFIITLFFLPLSGCDTALTVGSKTVGIRSGSFIYEDGYLHAAYNSPFDKVYTACEKTLLGMKAIDITYIRKISHGDFMAMLQDEKIRINVDYVEKGITSVSVMVGTSGNKIAAQLIHDRLEETLKMP